MEFIMKKALVFSLVFLFLSFDIFAKSVSKSQCDTKGDNFIFAGGECLETFTADGEREDFLNIIVHGTWKKGTNTLGRYKTFAENIAMSTDIKTVAISLPGYSKSSTNRFESLHWKGVGPLSAQKEYIDFMVDVVSKIKDKYKAKTITYIGHSAGAMIGATIAGYKPNLLNNIVAVGGVYDVYNDIKKDGKNSSYPKGLLSAIKYVDNISKDTKFILVYGTEDKISYPEFTTKFHKVLKSKNIDSTLVEVKGGVHIDLDMSDPSTEAISDMLEE
jgi:predicted esterase